MSQSLKSRILESSKRLSKKGSLLLGREERLLLELLDWIILNPADAEDRLTKMKVFSRQGASKIAFDNCVLDNPRTLHT